MSTIVTGQYWFGCSFVSLRLGKAKQQIGFLGGWNSEVSADL